MKFTGLSGREFEQALGAGDGQGGLVCCSPWGRKELDTNNNNKGGTEQQQPSEALTEGWGPWGLRLHSAYAPQVLEDRCVKTL